MLDLGADGTFTLRLGRPVSYWQGHLPPHGNNKTAISDRSYNANCVLDVKGQAIAVGDKNSGSALTKLRFQISSATVVPLPGATIADPTPASSGPALAHQITPQHVCPTLASLIQNQGIADAPVQSFSADHLDFNLNLSFNWRHSDLMYAVSTSDPRGPGATFFVRSGIPPLDMTDKILPKLNGTFRELNDDGTRPSGAAIGLLTIDSGAKTLSVQESVCGYTATSAIDRVLVGGGLAKMLLSHVTFHASTPAPPPATPSATGSATPSAPTANAAAPVKTRSDATCARMSSAWEKTIANSFVGLDGDVDNHQLTLELPAKTLAVDGDWGGDRDPNTDSDAASDFDSLRFEGVTF